MKTTIELEGKIDVESENYGVVKIEDVDVTTLLIGCDGKKVKIKIEVEN